MATDFGVDPSVTSLLGQMDVYLLVVTNPDGYAYTHAYVRLWVIKPELLLQLLHVTPVSYILHLADDF